jgi:hypothetical protein
MTAQDKQSHQNESKMTAGTKGKRSKCKISILSPSVRATNMQGDDGSISSYHSSEGEIKTRRSKAYSKPCPSLLHTCNSVVLEPRKPLSIVPKNENKLNNLLTRNKPMPTLPGRLHKTEAKSLMRVP